MGCGNRTKMIALLVFLVTFVVPTKGKTTCSADPVYVNDTATIICDFGQDLDPSATTLTIVHNNAEVVQCFPGPGNTSIFQTNKNYVLRNERVVTNPLFVDIPRVTPNLTGTYECHRVPSDAKAVKPCVLQVKERPVSSTVQPTPPTDGLIPSLSTPPADNEIFNAKLDGDDEETTDDKTSSATVPIVLSLLALLLIVVAILVFIFLKRRRQKKQFRRECNDGDNPEGLMESGPESLSSPQQ